MHCHTNTCTRGYKIWFDKYARGVLEEAPLAFLIFTIASSADSFTLGCFFLVSKLMFFKSDCKFSNNFLTASGLLFSPAIIDCFWVARLCIELLNLMDMHHPLKLQNFHMSSLSNYFPDCHFSLFGCWIQENSTIAKKWQFHRSTI